MIFMECNRDEALRAKSIADEKLEKKDYDSAKKFALKAQTLYPGLDGISRMLKTVDVLVSAEKKINGEIDLYAVLNVNPLANVETMRRQYKKLALLVHPDKNKCFGADGAFKLIGEAWTLLSDNAKRLAYNQKTGRRFAAPNAGPSAPARAHGSHNSASSTTSAPNAPSAKAAPTPTPTPASKGTGAGPSAPAKPNRFHNSTSGTNPAPNTQSAKAPPAPKPAQPSKGTGAAGPSAPANANASHNFTSKTTSVPNTQSAKAPPGPAPTPPSKGTGAAGPSTPAKATSVPNTKSAKVPLSGKSSVDPSVGPKTVNGSFSGTEPSVGSETTNDAAARTETWRKDIDEVNLTINKLKRDLLEIYASTGVYMEFHTSKRQEECTKKRKLDEETNCNVA